MKRFEDMNADEQLDAMANMSDRQWWNATGQCGGCGSDECHPGRPCNPSPGPDAFCTYCPNRGGHRPPAPPPDKYRSDGQQELPL